MAGPSLLLLGVLLSTAAFVSSNETDNLFQRYSKMKLLADCLGEVTIARWRQQVSKASEECDKSTPFIPALLHQTPVVQVQQRQPPFHFVPNNPVSQLKAPVFISGQPQHTIQFSPPQNYKTYFYVKQPYASVVISQPIGTPHFVPSSPAVHTFASKSQENTGPKAPAGQRNTYTDPDLTYEETQHYHDRQQSLRSTANAGVPTFGHRGPVNPPKPYIPSRRIQRDLSGFYVETKSEVKETESREQQLRSVLRSRVSEKLTKMTCIMRNMRMLDENLEPNTQFLEESLLELPISNDLFVQLRSGMDVCKANSACQSNRPSFTELPVTREFSSSLEFFRCFGRERLKACLKANVSGMIRLIESEQISDPISGFYEKDATSSSTVGELEELLIGATGQFTDLLLL